MIRMLPGCWPRLENYYNAARMLAMKSDLHALPLRSASEERRSLKQLGCHQEKKESLQTIRMLPGCWSEVAQTAGCQDAAKTHISIVHSV